MKLLSSKKYNILIKTQKELQKELMTTKASLASLEQINNSLQKKMQAYIDAQNKECKKGDYCKACIYSCKEKEFICSITSTSPIEYYVCCYNDCKHFEKGDE